jgi:hypothetical protein
VNTVGTTAVYYKLSDVAAAGKGNVTIANLLVNDDYGIAYIY